MFKSGYAFLTDKNSSVRGNRLLDLVINVGREANVVGDKMDMINPMRTTNMCCICMFVCVLWMSIKTTTIDQYINQ